MGMYAVSFLLPLLHFNVYPIYIEKSLGAKNTTSFAGTIESVVADQAIDMYKGVFIIYGVIALIFACRLLINLTTVLLRIWRSSKIVGPHYTVLEGQDSDKVYSFFRYLIKPKNQNLRDEILEHELIHIRQYHSIDLIISEIAKAILWFNPFVYLIQKTIKTNHEYICDSYASKINGRYNYAKLLSEISFGSSHLTCVNNFSYKLKNRIIMLQKLDKLTHRKWRYAMVLPLLLLGLHMYAFKTYRITTLPPVNEAAVDTIPYQVDTITIFDSDTYEETVRYEKFVTDTISTFDTDTYKETVTFERRVIEEGPITNDDINNTTDKVYTNHLEKEVKAAKRSPKKLKKIKRTIIKENKEELLDILGLKSFDGKRVDLEICITKSGVVEYHELLKSTTVSIPYDKEKAVLKSLYTNLIFEKGNKDQDCGIYIVE